MHAVPIRRTPTRPYTRPSGSPASSGSRGARRDLAQVQRLVEGLLVDAVLARDLAQRPAGGRRLLDDVGRAVIADERVQRGGDGQRALGGGLQAGRVGLDAVDALLGEQ